jgi:hypothetical protein
MPVRSLPHLSKLPRQRVLNSSMLKPETHLPLRRWLGVVFAFIDPLILFRLILASKSLH